MDEPQGEVELDAQVLPHARRRDLVATAQLFRRQVPGHAAAG